MLAHAFNPSICEAELSGSLFSCDFILGSVLSPSQCGYPVLFIITSKNLASFFLCPENFSEAELKDNGLICLTKEILRQEHLLCGMATFYYVYPGLQLKREKEPGSGGAHL